MGLCKLMARNTITTQLSHALIHAKALLNKAACVREGSSAMDYASLYRATHIHSIARNIAKIGLSAWFYLARLGFLWLLCLCKNYVLNRISWVLTLWSANSGRNFWPRVVPRHSVNCIWFVLLLHQLRPNLNMFLSWYCLYHYSNHCSTMTQTSQRDTTSLPKWITRHNATRSPHGSFLAKNVR